MPHHSLLPRVQRPGRRRILLLALKTLVVIHTVEDSIEAIGWTLSDLAHLHFNHRREWRDYWNELAHLPLSLRVALCHAGLTFMIFESLGIPDGSLSPMTKPLMWLCSYALVMCLITLVNQEPREHRPDRPRAHWVGENVRTKPRSIHSSD